MSDEFYLCELCNKKYKRIEKLEKHMLQDHEKILDKSEEIVPININIKTIKHKNRNIIESQQLELLKQQIEKKKDLEKIAKQKAEEHFLKEEFESIYALEKKKLRLLEEQLRSENLTLELENKFKNNASNNSSLCCICLFDIADHAPTTCGHKSFCKNCIYDFIKNYPQKGCPICRVSIGKVIKIF